MLGLLSMRVMKLFNRFPRWLRLLGLASFVALCVGINAIAIKGIAQLLSRPPVTAAPSETTALKISPVESPLEPSIESTNTPSLNTPSLNTPGLNTSSPTAKPEAKASTISTTAQINQVQTNQTQTNQTGAKATPANNQPSAQPKFGHRPYAALDSANLVQVASYPEGKSQRAEKMHPEAAAALLNMVAAARADGIWLVPASGFRTFAQQRTLFTTQVAKKGSPEAAAKISAPPGYSEHHTGYAIDLADGNSPQNQDISPAFVNTPAYRWLVNNAAAYSFELSFPANNPQGVSFEPWHWRYVGSPQARATFGKPEPAKTISGGTERLLE